MRNTCGTFLTGGDYALLRLMNLPQASEDTDLSGAQAGPRKVLLVDDEPSMVNLFSLILSNAGYFVKTALNGVSGLKLFQSAAWDLVITDRQMPQMGGERLAEEIKGLAPKTPVILITGFSGENLRPGLFETVLRKPFSKAALLSSVEGALIEHSAGVHPRPA
jgi:CheY-like chemotaxis protein